MPSYIDIQRWVQDTPRGEPNTETTTTASLARRKRVLSEMDINAEMGTPKRSMHTKKKTGAPSEVLPDGDPDSTPRAPPPFPLTTTAPVFQLSAQRKRQYDDDDGGGSNAGSSTTKSSTSKKSRRSESPQKELANAIFASYPVSQASLANLAEAPADVRELADKMEAIKRGFGILPESARNEAWLEALKTGKEQTDIYMPSVLFRASKGDNDDAAPDRAQLNKIVKQAEKNVQRAVSEPAWNCSVHQPLLNLALDGLYARNEFHFDNITTATIASPPSSLSIPPSSASRKVDFCLTLATPHAFKRHLVNHNIRIGQSDYPPIAFDSIATSIETKLAGEGGGEACRQLKVWVQAQVFRLRSLCSDFGDPNVEIPVLPLLFVQGNEWRFLCFKDIVGENRGVFYSDRPTLFGSTSNLLEACQVVAGLRVLVRWADSVWAPWLKKQVLEKIVGKGHADSAKDELNDDFTKSTNS